MEKLVELPQSGVIIDITEIRVMGEPKPGQWIVALNGTTQGAVVPTGDRNAIVEELRKRGLLVTLEAVKVEPPAAANETPPEGMVQVEK